MELLMTHRMIGDLSRYGDLIFDDTFRKNGTVRTDY